MHGLEPRMDMEPGPEPKRSVEDWASLILDALQDLKGLDLNLDQTRRTLVKFPANNADYVVVTFDQPSEYVYVPTMPRNVAVHFGTGPGQLLANVGVNEPLLVRFPRIDALTFLPDAGTGNADQFDLWFSTRPIDLGGIAFVTQFATALASDTLPNPTTAEVLSFEHGYDSVNNLWRRVRVGSAGAGLGVLQVVMPAISLADGVGIGALIAPDGTSRSLGTTQFAFNGTNADRVRTATVFKPFAATAIVAGTGITVWTPAGGKKFRLMGWSLSTNTAADLIFGDNTAAAVFMRTGVQQINTVVSSPPGLGNGFLSAAANNVLKLDVSVGATVGGMVFGTEE